MMPTFARNRGQKPLVELQATSGTRFEAPTTKIHQSTQDAHRERSYAGFLTRPARFMRRFAALAKTRACLSHDSVAESLYENSRCPASQWMTKTPSGGKGMWAI